MTELINLIDNILWSSALVYLLLGAGIYFTIRSRFIQFRHFGHMISLLKSSNKAKQGDISSLQALCTSLAAYVGTGNITGVAIALAAGGPGAIFWMWIVALFGMSTSFVESTLAQLYKTKDEDGNYRGGPAYYMEYGLGMRWMGVLFSIFLIITFGLVLNTIQASAIIQTSTHAFNIPPFYIGFGLMILSGLVIFGGLRTVVKSAQIIVPLMTVAYLLIALWITSQHLEKIPDIFMLIIKSAFGLQEAATGTVAYSISQAITMGAQRGLLSNEAGMGSAPNAASCATPYPHHPVSQGFVQMFGVFFDTIVICTATAAIILSSGLLDNGPTTVDGTKIIQQAMSIMVGSWGDSLIAVVVFFFAFTSIIASYIYIENNLFFLKQHRNIGLLAVRCAILGTLMIGVLTEMSIIWKVTHILTALMALMTICNLIAILLLSGTAIRLYHDYNYQRRLGKLPVFNIERFPDIQSQVEPGIWNSPEKK